MWRINQEISKGTENIKDRTIAGHNVQFDFNFLSEHFIFYNLGWPFGYRMVDLHSVFYFHLLKKGENAVLKNKVSGLGLDFIIDYLKLPKRIGFHNALEDAKLTAKAFSLLLKEERCFWVLIARFIYKFISNKYISM